MKGKILDKNLCFQGPHIIVVWNTQYTKQLTEIRRMVLGNKYTTDSGTYSEATLYIFLRFNK